MADYTEQNRATADRALALLQRLKSFTVPAGREPAAREIVERCAARVRWEDAQAEDILAALQTIEGDLIALGAESDPEVAEALAMVQRTFPGARLDEVLNGTVWPTTPAERCATRSPEESWIAALKAGRAGAQAEGCSVDMPLPPWAAKPPEPEEEETEDGSQRHR